MSDVARPMPWRKQYRVDARYIVGPGKAMEHRLRRARHPPQALFVERLIERAHIAPPFDFDKGNCPPPSHDKIDFAHTPPLPDPLPPGEHAPSLALQIERRETFALVPLSIGSAAVHTPTIHGSESARA